MCLVGISLDKDKGVSIYANRDEFHSRPTAGLHYWALASQAKKIIAGKDLKLGGTWLGVEPSSSRWACILNFRSNTNHGDLSRGHIVTDCLDSSQQLSIVMHRILANISNYRPFVLLAGDKTGAWALQTGMDNLLPLQLGIHTVSNGGLNVQWPKQQELQVQIQQLESQSTECDTLSRQSMAMLKGNPSCMDPNQSGSDYFQALEHTKFIVSPSYGTRSSAYVHLSHKKSIIFEQTFQADGSEQSLARQFTW